MEAPTSNHEVQDSSLPNGSSHSPSNDVQIPEPNDSNDSVPSLVDTTYNNTNAQPFSGVITDIDLAHNKLEVLLNEYGQVKDLIIHDNLKFRQILEYVSFLHKGMIWPERNRVIYSARSKSDHMGSRLRESFHDGLGYENSSLGALIVASK